MYIAVATGWIALIYGLLQAYSLVSIDSISGSNNRSTSFFGNTNFHSSFIGIVATIALSLGLQNQTNTLRRLYLISFCAIAPFAISKSDSQQGFLVIFIGFSVVIFEYFRIRFRPIFSRVFGLSSLVVLTLISFGLFQRGPLEELVYEESISSRGFYMRAGIKMFTDNPIFGVGYDGYRDWYRRSRGEEALASSSLGAKDISDSAHNYFIDVAASGGVVFGLSLIILWIYIFFCAFKILQRSTKFEGISIAVVASFAAFTTQLFISLPQIGLTVWGWSLGGLVVAIYLNKGEEVFQKNYIYKLKPKMIIASFTLFTLGLVLTIPVFYSSYEYRKSIETQDVQRLQRAALLFPREANMLSASGGALIGIEEYEKAKQLLTVAKDTFPQFFESWYLYSLLPNITTQELSNAKIKMSQLEPLLSEDMDEQIEK
jgi:O-antigen ligase